MDGCGTAAGSTRCEVAIVSQAPAAFWAFIVQFCGPEELDLIGTSINVVVFFWIFFLDYWYNPQTEKHLLRYDCGRVSHFVFLINMLLH